MILGNQKDPFGIIVTITQYTGSPQQPHPPTSSNSFTMPPKRTAPMASTTGPKPKRSRPTFQEVNPTIVISSSADATPSIQVPTNPTVSELHLSKLKQPKFQAVISSPALRGEPPISGQATSSGTDVITLGTTAKGRRNYCMQHLLFLSPYSYSTITLGSTTLAPQIANSHVLSPASQVTNTELLSPSPTGSILDEIELEPMEKILPPSKPKNTTKVSSLPTNQHLFTDKFTD